MTFSEAWERMRPLDGIERQPVVWAMMHRHAFDPVAFLLNELENRYAAQRPALPVHPLEKARLLREWDREQQIREEQSPDFEEVESALIAAWEVANRERRTVGLVLDSFDRIAALPTCPIGSAGWGMHIFDYMKIIREKKIAEQRDNFVGECYMGPNNAT